MLNLLYLYNQLGNELTVDKDNTIHIDNVLTEGASQNNMLKNDYTFEN